MSKKYGERIKIIKRPKRFIKKLCISLLFLIVLTSLFFGGVGIANLLSNNEFQIFGNGKINIGRINYYAIHFGEFDTKNDALECSIWTASSGGSAYIYEEGKYYVVGQLYDNIDDAEKVLKNFSSDLTYTPNIINIKTKSVSLSINNVIRNDKKTILYDINLIDKTIKDVLKISNNLDKNLISNVTASSEVNSLKSKIKLARLQLINLNLNYNSDKLNKVIEYFVSAEDCLDVCITKLLSTDNYNSVIKYCACELFFNYYDFVKNFDK